MNAAFPRISFRISDGSPPGAKEQILTATGMPRQEAYVPLCDHRLCREALASYISLAPSELQAYLVLTWGSRSPSAEPLTPGYYLAAPDGAQDLRPATCDLRPANCPLPTAYCPLLYLPMDLGIREPITNSSVKLITTRHVVQAMILKRRLFL
jgi:hypothetical protein